jgi:peptidoglycan/LPS O-acetylase OafA/YrhL
VQTALNRAPLLNSYHYRFFGLFRFVLAALVMVQHFAASIAPQFLMQAIRPYEPGSVAVLAFFCLSGFVIAESADLAYANRARAFLANRALRIFPHFILAVLISICLQWVLATHQMLQLDRSGSALPEGAFSVSNILSNLVMIVPFLEHGRVHSFIPIAWAVRVEVAFYCVIFAALVLVKMKPNNKSFSFGTICAWIALFLTPAFILSLHHKAPAMLGFVPYFVFGVSAYFVNARARLAPLIAAMAAIGMLWHFLAQPAQHPTYGFERNVLSQLALLVTLIASMCYLAGVRAKRLEAFDAQLGTYTYPLYLYHYLVVIAVASLFPGFALKFFFLGLFASVVVSIAMASFVDPVIDQTRDKIRGRALTRTSAR